MNDRDIVKNLKNGDEECIKYLYEHFDMVKGFVTRNSGTEADAFDLFQEAIVIFYKKVNKGEFLQDSKISTFLFGICRNQWMNNLKKQKRERNFRDKLLKEQKSSENHVPPPNITGITEGYSKAAYLNQMLNKLGEKCKSILEASIFLHLKMEVIANKYGYANAHSARQQKLRCLKRLRSMVSYEFIMSLE